MIVDSLHKVKKKGKGAHIYRGNGMEDEGTLQFEQVTIKNVPCVPTTFMTLG